MVTELSQVNVVLALAYQYPDLDIYPKIFVGRPTGITDLSTAWLWQSTETLEPTPAELIQWENERLAEIEQEEQRTQAVLIQYQSYNVSFEEYLAALTVQTRIATGYDNGNPKGITVLFNGFGDELNGSAIEPQIRAWVEDTTGLSSFNTITDAQKRQVILATTIFLGGIIGTYETAQRLGVI